MARAANASRAQTTGQAIMNGALARFSNYPGGVTARAGRTSNIANWLQQERALCAETRLTALPDGL